MLQRDVLSRHDTAERRAKVASARQVIYEQQFAVDTAQVEALLKPESLVPTSVCLLRFGIEVNCLPLLFRMRFQQDSVK